MVRGEGGRLYDAFREREVAALGWSQLAAHAKPGVGRQQLIELAPTGARTSSPHPTALASSIRASSWRSNPPEARKTASDIPL